MHPNTAFRKPTKEQNVAFARQRSFGVLAINCDRGPLISHVPFQLSADGAFLEAHLVRSNPILKRLDNPVSAVIAVSGGDAYISPDWYGIDDQVPTWNYVAIHIRGELRELSGAELSGVLDRISANMEERLFPKTPWTTEKMSSDVYAKMKRQIVPIGMQVSEIAGTWKLSQNKDAELIKRTVNGLRQSGFGSEVDQIIQLMAEDDE